MVMRRRRVRVLQQLLQCCRAGCGQNQGFSKPRFWATVLLVQRTSCAFVTFLLFMALAAISHLALCSRCCTDWMSRFMRLGALCRACVTAAAACNKLVEASHEMLAGTFCMLGWGLHAVLSGFLQLDCLCRWWWWLWCCRCCFFVLVP